MCLLLMAAGVCFDASRAWCSERRRAAPAAVSGGTAQGFASSERPDRIAPLPSRRRPAASQPTQLVDSSGFTWRLSMKLESLGYGEPFASAFAAGQARGHEHEKAQLPARVISAQREQDTL